MGKEISGWIEKLFEVKIKPRTIEQRARRKNATNVTIEPNPFSNTLHSVEKEILVQAKKIRAEKRKTYAEVRLQKSHTTEKPVQYQTLKNSSNENEITPSVFQIP